MTCLSFNLLSSLPDPFDPTAVYLTTAAAGAFYGNRRAAGIRATELVNAENGMQEIVDELGGMEDIP